MNTQNLDKTLFWEADFGKLNLEKDYYIINRILTKGEKKIERRCLNALHLIKFNL